ncbi:UDP-N-acetylmuramate dehydrogenase [Candidatus Dependentiae bacterium]|nr:UDP-N-acetylmuramate dehydrogenase [Candidatus Dependentiae bacterium]MCC7414834.1 UDP-N-acetylmuramate dehydrogenase [Campylobacterota bacterium]
MITNTVLAQQSMPSSLHIQSQVPLADKTWFKVGGPARFFCEPTSAAEFQQAVAWAQEQRLAVFVLGEGANILISDAGFDGLVIRPALRNILIHDGAEQSVMVTAEAGVSLPDLITFCLDKNILGLEEFSGIPGTVGGSVYINLHYFEFLLSQFLVSAQVVNRQTGQVQTMTNDWFNFGYNQSTLQAKEWYLLDATFKLRRCSDLEAAYARGRRIEIIRHRVSRYPAKNTCGSFFRNFHNDEVTVESNGKKMIYVAYYLDKIGVKGTLSVGGAVVSYQHANMLVNKGNATSADLVQLARAMQELVRQQFGITPQPECILVGFDTYPLL